MPHEYAVIGWPLGHTMSPVIHNASFHALGLECTFSARELHPDAFDRFMRELPRSSFKGLAVTIPYKTKILSYCHEQDSTVSAIGAANTLRVEPGGALAAFNTDAPGAGRALAEAGVDVKGSRTVVIGAGGAARAICFQLMWDGAASIAIVNRTLSRAESLRGDLLHAASRDVTITASPLEKNALSTALEDARLFINTTSIGMYPRVDECPLDPDLLHDGIAVFDIVYNPVETKLLRAAKAAGAKTVPGTEMLLHQAAAQQRIWRSIDAPLNTMRAALLQILHTRSCSPQPLTQNNSCYQPVRMYSKVVVQPIH